MAIDGIGTSAATDAASATDKKKPKDIKDLDINEFLQIMIAELTNQDPLNPMDNTQLVQQIGSIREIAATDKLSTSLESVQTGQSLSTASALIGRKIQALSDDQENVEGIVERVTIDVDEDNPDKRTYRVHVDGKNIDLRNVREILPAD
ncbi:Basal-body rod modification protein FlgD [Anatilimnocola aggregata]|uniref:Basal-body rod modification protein FlgD n=1 Tax=Anatilimnocola aggregata TaxID=2528021 RepID=A0A517Y9R0_9BACT|nr:flagellar hook capping FlgD N-terminal domain-containing protein [Anatilimnocola aggregata]QDU26966.1 Basal-body rod modification protein FlgD [Anatilimnocola aggregata]